MRAFLAWWLALLVALAGCASTPQATTASDAEAKRFLSHPGLAAVYVFRPDFTASAMEDTILHVDDRLIGQTLPGTFFRVDVQPGAHVVRASAAGATAIAINARTGELYFVQLDVSDGGSRLALVEPAKAQAIILKCCALMENWAPAQRPLLR
jgi:uncharacterized protein DUF2846